MFIKRVVAVYKVTVDVDVDAGVKEPEMKRDVVPPLSDSIQVKDVTKSLFGRSVQLG